ncbi:NAD(P)H-binding protein [Mycolicibacterium sp. S2-37]|uniref:SDR family oxidoreductase n=1 Tax=Mycolicibacterium sp. S2-37 TaxID=2810297 RepID=UPI001A93AF9E|nr:NAD(P)H-binding protein [Mycolicibacterium sp. S2-37]MBO0679130.1 NAD(P)H-binding protein [Mycolicibacterium sp. S2-37]
MVILVTGGTGLLGGEVVARLTVRGHSVRILSRTSRPHGHADVVAGDLGTGAGLEEALAGVDTVVHLASDPKRPQEVDVEGTRHLVAAATAAGVGHVVYISIVGADRIPLGYYRAKIAVEQLIEQSGIPYTILRASQFHEFTADILGTLAKLPVTIAPRGWRIQPIDVGAVATHLADAVESGPTGRLPDLAGPQDMTWADAIGMLRTAAGRRTRVLAVPVPGAFSAAWRSGAATAEPTAGHTFAEFLADRRRTPVR